MTDAYDYADINECEIGPGEAIRRVGAKSRGPAIRWGDKFETWPEHKQISFLKRFGESMNHAADLKQREFVELCEVAKKQELQLVQIKQHMHKQACSFNAEMARQGKIQQDMAAEIEKAHGVIRKARRMLKLGLKQQEGEACSLEAVQAAVEELSCGD